MKNLMLDLETMGTKPGCAVVSIGAVFFNIETGAHGPKFYMAIDLNSCVAAGLKIDVTTLQWWMKQNDNARRKLQENTEELKKVAQSFIEFIMLNSDEHVNVWGNSASFDCSIWAKALEAVGFEIPWLYYNEKCYRTITKLFPANQFKKDSSKSHDPIYDCEYQIGVLCATWKKINNKNFV